MLPRNYKIFLSLGMLATYKHIAFPVSYLWRTCFRYHVVIALSLITRTWAVNVSIAVLKLSNPVCGCFCRIHKREWSVMPCRAPQHQHRIQIVINVKRYAWDCERWNPECQLDARQRPSLVRGWNGITAEDLERNFGRSMCLFKWVQRVHGRYWLEISCEMYLSPHLNSPRLYSTLHRCKGNYLIRDTK